MWTDKITFDYLTENNYPSVTDYCRDLIKKDAFPDVVEVYRGDMLCLTADVRKAAKLAPTGTGWETYRENKNKRAL